MYRIFIFLGLLLMGCSSTKSHYFGKNRRVVKSIDKSEIFQDHFTGFVLYDPIKKKNLIDLEGDKYFTPASNTKIFTFYTALESLGDSIPVLQYATNGDSVIIQGTGNPLFLNPLLSDSTAFHFLRNFESVNFNNDNFSNPKYGSGWAWDDAKYSYQPEITSMPIYGNLMQNKPIEFNDSVFLSLISQNLDRKVFYGDNRDSIQLKTLRTAIPDSLYMLLMHDSDNHVAEQLLLMASHELLGELNTKKMIAYALEHYFNDLKNKPRWVDGSGLSRYNLFTPNSIIQVLEKIYNKIGVDGIQLYFPAAGESGTVKNFYGSPTAPYIYAKTGTLSNNHNLSGYLFTKSGRMLMFSFMHNHYIYGSSVVKGEMSGVLRGIWETY